MHHKNIVHMRISLINQRKERDKLLSQPYIQRQLPYDAEQLLLNHNIKLITGPRRVGKSTQALLMLRDTNFAYINFDDNSLLSAWDEDAAMDILEEVYPEYEYLLLDEVQNVDGWDVWVSKLHRRGVNMVITGSNANMLSGEMATMLTGRYIEIKLLPFGLEEFCIARNIDLHNVQEEDKIKLPHLLDEYLQMGGYPESVLQRSITQTYLSSLFDSIIYKDIVKRHKVRNVVEINNVAEYLLSNFCNLFSYNDLCSNLGLNSVSTVKKFTGYLHEPFLFFYLSRYNNKLQLMKKAPQKVYVVDNGLVYAKAFNISENIGRLLENQVFIELVRRGYDTARSLFYYRSRNDKEVDFVLRKGVHAETLLQVCYDMSLPKTEKREVDSIIECAQELHCTNLIIVTAREERVIEKNGYAVRVMPWELFVCSDM